MSEELLEQEAAIDENLENEQEGEREIPEIDSKYRMIILAAQRSKQLQRGANIRINDMNLAKHKPTRVAMEEIKRKTVNFKFLEEDR
jgi:DNA-directed RNA polymerase omega subunit